MANPWESDPIAKGAAAPQGKAAPWEQDPVQPTAPGQSYGAGLVDPSAGGGTLQFGPFDTGVPISEGVNRFLAGAGKAITDIGAGAEQFGRSLVPGVSQEEAALNEQIEERKRLDAPLMRTGAGIAGNVVGNVAAATPAMLVPGVNTYTGAAAMGGALGALQPVAQDESRLANTAMSAGGGVVGRGLVNTLSRVLAPKTASAAQGAIKEQIPLTPGQTLGGAFKRVEEGLKSVPVAGDFVRSAERRSMEGFNRAALNRVLSPIGQKAGKIGREGIEEAGTKVSAAYQRLLPKLKVNADAKLARDVDAAIAKAGSLPRQMQEQLKTLIRDQFSKTPAQGKTAGEVMKEVDSELGRIARGYMSNPAFESRELGARIRDVQSALRGAVRRSNPEYRSQLKNIDRAYAALLRVENAAGRAGSKEGVFSPAALRAATRQMDPSLRRRAFARGQANMQGFAEGAESVLGSTVPDSGTPFRLANILMAGGGYAIDPSIAASMGTVGAAYSAPVQRAIVAALAKRPDAIRGAGTQIAKGASLGALLGSSLTNSSRRNR